MARMCRIKFWKLKWPKNKSKHLRKIGVNYGILKQKLLLIENFWNMDHQKLIFDYFLWYRIILKYSMITFNFSRFTSSLLLVYGPFGRATCTLVFCPRPARKKTECVSMTQLLPHTFAHLTGPSFRLKVKLLPNKNRFFRSYVNLHKSCWKLQNSDFQSQFSTSKIIRIFLNFFFIEEYLFRSTFFVIDIFWQIQFLKHFIF